MTHCRQVMLEELQRRNFAPTTISSYLHAVEPFARHFKCRPDRLNRTHFPSYQAYLLRERKMRPLTVRHHVAALRFFFVKTLKRRYLLDETPYPKAPRRLPQILSVEEVVRLIDAADSLSHRTMLMVLYSTGMRNAELRQLQVADIDSRRMLIHIQRGKGDAIDTCHSARHCSRRCACTTGGCGRGRGCFPGLSMAGAPTSPSRPRSSGMPVSSRPVAPGAASGARRTSCAIRMPRTYSRVAPTSGRFSCSSVTWRSGTRCCISIFRRSICRPSRIRWMRSRSQGPTPHVGPG